MGDFQEAPQVESSAPFCKWAYMVERAQRIPMSINTAVRYALSGRPGSVYIDLPAEVINAPVEQEDVHFPAPIGDPPRPQGDTRAVEEALRVLRSAERPLMIIGKGTAWSRAEDELRAFVDKVQIYESIFQPRDLRLINEATFSTKITGIFSLKLSNLLLYDNVPVEGFRKFDQTTLVTIVADLI